MASLVRAGQGAEIEAHPANRHGLNVGTTRFQELGAPAPELAAMLIRIWPRSATGPYPIMNPRLLPSVPDIAQLLPPVGIRPLS